MASKKMMEAFHKKVIKIVQSFGGAILRTDEDGRCEMTINTKAGLLYITMHAASTSSLFAVFMRFEDVDLANKILGDDSQNKFSGKWNLLELREDDCLETLNRRLSGLAKTPQTSMQKYPEFQSLVDEIANDVCKTINVKAKKIKSQMPYKAQFTLEEVIKVLQSRV